MTEPIEITEVDKLAPVWQKINDHFERRLASLRLQNDGVQSEIETALVRGRIAEIKRFFDLVKEYPNV